MGLGIEFIDQDDPKIQRDMKEAFEKALMYLNIIDPDDLPEELREELIRLSRRMAEVSW